MDDVYVLTEPHCAKRVVAHPQCHDFLQQVLIFHAAMFRRIGEIFIARDLRIGVRLERVNSAVLGQPVINPRITAEAEYAVDAF